MLTTLIFFCKHHIWENSFSGVIAGKKAKALNQIEWIDLIDCIWTDNEKRKRSILIFLIRCSGMPSYIQSFTWAQRISESCSFTENIIEWKIKRKGKSQYIFFFMGYYRKFFCLVRYKDLLISQTSRGNH